MISAVGPEIGSCPGCRKRSTRLHSRYFRHLQNLPVQGAVVTVKLRVSRWRCLNGDCEHRTFADQLPEIVSPHARRTRRIAEIIHLFGHGTGGRPGERLMKRLGMPVSDDTVLRQLKRQVAMRFRGILRSKDTQKFDVWLNDAQQSGIYAIHRFARTLRRDVDAVRNSLTKGWSNGQTEGQINRLKTLKRAMYGRASTELLRARMLPLHLPIQHGK